MYNTIEVYGGFFGSNRYFKKDKIRVLTSTPGSSMSQSEVIFETEAGEILRGTEISKDYTSTVCSGYYF